MDVQTRTEAPNQYWPVNLILISLGALISALAVSSINVSLPALAIDLHTSTGLASASVIAYLLVLS
ncbi:MAG: hypothetical protein Q7T80_04990, partial [Methanoregula sp.]|nr:hypothetical protein [Methanoregula sp.]